MRVCPQCEQEFPDDVRVCPVDDVPTLDTSRCRDPLLNKVLDGRWKLVEQLGRGGMGKIYRSTQLSIHREVAIKVIKTPLLPSEQLISRFMREAQSLSAMRHPNIVGLIDFGQDETSGLLYIVMELLPGRSLHYILDNKGTLSLLQIVKLGEQLMSALVESHSKGIIHRDIKPSNMMLEQLQGVGIHITLVDFGLAHTAEAASEQLTRRGGIQGTPRYMPPEQIKGESLTPRSDLYAAGVLFYQLLAGKVPFDGRSAFEILNKQLKFEAAPLREAWSVSAPVNEELSALVTEMMAKSPSVRPASALVVLQRLQSIRSSIELTLRQQTSAETLTRKTLEELVPDNASKPEATLQERAREGATRAMVPHHRRGVILVAIMSLALFLSAIVMLFNVPGDNPVDTTATHVSPIIPSPPLDASGEPLPVMNASVDGGDSGEDGGDVKSAQVAKAHSSAANDKSKETQTKVQRQNRASKRKRARKKSPLEATLEAMSNEEP